MAAKHDPAVLYAQTESPLDLAAYATVHDYPGGAPRLGAQTGIHPGTLSNKVNPGCEGHRLTLDEALRIQAMSGDCRIHEAMGMLLGRLSIPAGNYSGTSDVELLQVYANLHRETGETAAAIAEALRDGDITPHELATIRHEMYQDWCAGAALLARLEALCEGPA